MEKLFLSKLYTMLSNLIEGAFGSHDISPKIKLFAYSLATTCLHLIIITMIKIMVFLKLSYHIEIEN